MEETVLPPQAHALAAKIEDQIRIWRDRDPANPHLETRRAAERATRLCGDMIQVFHELREQLTTELGEYDDAVRRLRHAH